MFKGVYELIQEYEKAGAAIDKAVPGYPYLKALQREFAAAQEALKAELGSRSLTVGAVTYMVGPVCGNCGTSTVTKVMG